MMDRNKFIEKLFEGFAENFPDLTDEYRQIVKDEIDRAKRLIADALGWPAERLVSAFSDIAYGIGRKGVARRAPITA